MNMKICEKILLSIVFAVFVLVGNTFCRGWVYDGGDAYYLDETDQPVTETIKPSGDDKYYLDSDGMVARDYLLESYDDNIYYFDDSGKMVKNTWVAVDPLQVEFGMDNAPTIYLYYFGPSGKAFKAKNGVVRKVIDGKKYLFNENGQMLSGWIDENGDTFNEYESTDDPFVGYTYYAGDETDGVLREGWMEFLDGSTDDKYYTKESLWFYFKTSNNKKVVSTGKDYTKKKINGHTYAFDENGVMIQGWDSDMINGLTDTNLYFSEERETIGRMSKKQWIHAVPSAIQDQEDHDQETLRWFYASAGGDAVKNTIKKINKDFFVFNDQGIMKAGLCIVDKNTKQYIDSIDLERTDCKDFILSRYYISEKNKNKKDALEYSLFDSDTQQMFYFLNDETDENYGARKVNKNLVSFFDDDYYFNSTNMGQTEGKKKNYYYQAGILLKPDINIGMGIVLVGYSSSSEATAPDGNLIYNNSQHSYAHADKNHKVIVNGVETDEYIMTDYIVDNFPQVASGSTPDSIAYPVYAVVDSKGNKLKKSYTAKKDRDNNYWLIGGNATFQKIFEVPIKYVKGEAQWYFKSEFEVEGSNGNKTKSSFQPFGTIDIYGKTCNASREVRSDYEVRIDDIYALNFRFVDNY